MKSFVKSISRSALGLSFGLVQTRAFHKALSIFVYHDISEVPSEFSSRHALNTPPSLFIKQVNFIDRHFNVISADDFLSGKLPSRAAMITFDDGFKSVFTTALPLLRARKFSATIFLNMGAVQGRVLWSALVTMLSARKDFLVYCAVRGIKPSKGVPLFLKCRKDLVEGFLNEVGRKNLIDEALRFQGAFASIGDMCRADGKGVCYANHLYDHQVPLLMTKEEFIDAYSLNVHALKEFNSYRNLFSFPFGQPGSCFDRRHVEMVAALGAKAVFFSRGGVNFPPFGMCLDRLELLPRDTTDLLMRHSLLRAVRIGRRKANWDL